MNDDRIELHCRVCGLYSEDPPRGGPGELPQFDLCPCCGITIGYQDDSPASAREYRAQWLARGAPWSSRFIPPDGLTTEQRLNHVPPGFGVRVVTRSDLSDGDPTSANLVSHYIRHRDEFPDLRGVDAYLAETRQFLAEPPWGTRTGVRPNGDVIRFHKKRNLMAVMSKDGAPRTLLRPSHPSPKDYFLQLAGAARGFVPTSHAGSHCRVCGYDDGQPQWANGGLDPEFDLCPCCLAETGHDDWTPTSTRAYRAGWLATGAPWSITFAPHDGLTTAERLTHVPPGFDDEP